MNLHQQNKMARPRLTPAERTAREQELSELNTERAKHNMAIASFQSIMEDARNDLLSASAAGKDLLDIQQTIDSARVCKQKHHVKLCDVLEKVQLVECELATGEKSVRSWPEPAIKPDETSEPEEANDGGARLVEELEVDNADQSSDDGSITPTQSETLVQSSTRGSGSTSDTTSTMASARRGSWTEVRLKLAIRQQSAPAIESKMVITTEPDGDAGDSSTTPSSSSNNS
ncbi:hypothetical protein CC79DRAFT_822136 [Sarocladium strictum]